MFPHRVMPCMNAIMRRKRAPPRVGQRAGCARLIRVSETSLPIPSGYSPHAMTSRPQVYILLQFDAFEARKRSHIHHSMGDSIDLARRRR